MAPTMIVSPFIFESCLFRVRVVPPWRADFSKNILWRIFRNRAGLSVNHPRRFYVVPLCTVKKTANKGVARGRKPLHAALDRKFMATRIRARRRFAQAKNGVSTHGIRRVFPVKNERQQKCRKTSEANSAQSAERKVSDRRIALPDGPRQKSLFSSPEDPHPARRTRSSLSSQ